jgi:hypothetical protein
MKPEIPKKKFEIQSHLNSIIIEPKNSEDSL